MFSFVVKITGNYSSMSLANLLLDSRFFFVLFFSLQPPTFNASHIPQLTPGRENAKREMEKSAFESHL